MSDSGWKAILSEAQGQWTEQGLTHLTHAGEELAAAQGGSVVCPLVHLAVWQVSGADAADFLQGQLSNDVRALLPGHSQLAGYCTPKGRMLALFRVIRATDGFLLLLPASIAQGVLKRLRMFVLRAKVSIEDVSDRRLALGLSGSEAAAGLRALLGALPEQVDQGLVVDGHIVVRVAGEPARFLVVADAPLAAAVWTQLRERAKPAGTPVWHWLEARAGLPQVFAQTQEAFVPQMANLDLVNGLSFTKGCYPGQEIVARMHYLGNLKRRMYRLRGDGDVPPPGAELRGPDGSLVGETVLATPAPSGGWEGLAVVQLDRAQAGELRLNDAPVEVLPPPYPFTA